MWRKFQCAGCFCSIMILLSVWWYEQTIVNKALWCYRDTWAYKYYYPDGREHARLVQSLPKITLSFFFLLEGGCQIWTMGLGVSEEKPRLLWFQRLPGRGPMDRVSSSSIVPSSTVRTAWMMSCSSSDSVSLRYATRISGTLVRRMSLLRGPSLK